MKILVFSNDVVPGMGIPVAAPGLRSWSIAAGLQGLGHDVELGVDARVLPLAWKRRIPAALPSATVMFHPQYLRRYVKSNGVDALIVTNSNAAEYFRNVDVPVIYDFFAPKVLELEEQLRTVRPAAARRARAELVRRKLMGLRNSSGVIINGVKKRDYVAEWLDRAGVPELPTAVVNMSLPPRAPQRRERSELHAVVSGYLQPWSAPGSWVESLRPLLEGGDVVFHLLLGQHWGKSEETEWHPRLREIAEYSHSVIHRPMPFESFRSVVGSCDLAIDIFERNSERELAMVTRSVVALSTGVPVAHVPFTEVSPIIADSGAGWLVDDADENAVSDLVRAMVADREHLDTAQSAAVRLSRGALDPATATAPLDKMLREVLE